MPDDAYAEDELRAETCLSRQRATTVSSFYNMHTLGFEWPWVRVKACLVLGARTSVCAESVHVLCG